MSKVKYESRRASHSSISYSGEMAPLSAHVFKSDNIGMRAKVVNQVHVWHCYLIDVSYSFVVTVSGILAEAIIEVVD